MHDARESKHSELVFELITENTNLIESVIVRTLGDYFNRQEVFSDIVYDAVSHAVTHYNSKLCSDFTKYMLYTVHFYAKKWRTKKNKLAGKEKNFTDICDFIESSISDNVSLSDNGDEINTRNSALEAKELVSILVPDSGITEFELYIVTYHICYDMTFDMIGAILPDGPFPKSTVIKYFQIGMNKLRRCANG